jgi:Fe-S oxidoreductase
MMHKIIFAIVLISGIIFFIHSIRSFLSYIKLGKPENRLNNINIRIKNLFKFGILNSKLFKRKIAGLFHISIFWGFCILTLVVLENIIEGFIDNFSFSFLGGIYNIITFTEDVFGGLVIIVVLISIFRRYFFTPKRLQVDTKSRLDATLILLLILFVITTMFLTNVERILLNNSEGYRPLSNFISRIFTGGNSSLYSAFWWAHNIIILCFLNYLPYSKHFHVLSSLPNTFLSNNDIEKKNILKPINFEDESIEQYGAKDIEDLSWKQLLDGYTCTECGRCTEKCPANITGKLLSPKIIITQTRKRTTEKGKTLSSKSKNDEIIQKSLVNNYVTQEELWACTTCGACVEECPVLIDHLTSIIEMRRHLTMMESAFPQELNVVFRNLENNESPWAFGADARNEWIDEFKTETEKEGIENKLVKLSNTGTAENLDIVFWVGCAGAFDQRYRIVTKSVAKILSKAGITFGVLGNEEKCNGDTARRLGNEFLAQQFIQQNIETFNKYKIRKIVTACPHCFHSLNNEYPKFGIELNVIHHTDFIYELIKNKKIIPSKKIDSALTFHDSCYLGRYNNIYNQPRNIINSVTKGSFYELKRNKKNGFCCGAGGGRMFMEETEGKRVNIERTEDIINSNADTVCTACPFCMTMLSDGLKSLEKSDTVKIKDIAEITYESL